MEEDTKKQIQEISEKIAKKFKPEKIILFGSFAWGEPGPDSDVDLFIVKQTEDTRKSARLINRSIFPRPFPLDLIVYTPTQVKRRTESGDFFVKQVMTRGKILYPS